ncbi:MAG: hypothetical protein ACLQU5_10805 [Isosphaeraceae bacterium]
MLKSLPPHLVRSLGDPAQELRVADDALGVANRFEIRENLGVDGLCFLDGSQSWVPPSVF